MKRCPQCNSVYTDDMQYCPNDNQPLISEVLPLPSQVSFNDEEQTLIRHEPIVVDLSALNAPPQQISPPVEKVTVIRPVEAKSSSGKYLVFLIVGLLLGGGLVLATLLLSRSFYQSNDSGNTRIISGVNANEARNSGGEPKNTASPVNKPTPASSEHQERTKASDDEFNGRVITLNAYVRSSPSRTASEIDVLPIDDRLTITDRENPGSPWFHVVCEHGTSGWMHGNTIEYTR